ncbi:membrane protein [Prevotella aurantiaca JCM 15754]
MLVFLALSSSVKAGGLLTNTNQSIAFLRSLARNGAIGIDGVYSNPAGVAFLPNGLHISFNVQNVYQTRIINSGLTIPALQGTPYYQPFKMNGGDKDGIKKFKGEASAPIIPSFQIAKNYDKWGFQMGFGIVGGGGKATFNGGLPSFERQIAMIPGMLASQGLTTTEPGYSVSSYMHGQQYDFGLQLGATYKINDKLAVYGGARFNYIYNKYEGNIVNISANIDGKMENLYDYFGTKANAMTQLAIQNTQMAAQATDPTAKAQYEAAAKKYQAGADQLNKTKTQFADRYLDCTQRGWGITPIIGIDYKTGRWNLAARYEFTTKFNIENNTKRDDTGQFQHGVNTPNDLPGLLSLGAQYEVLDNLRLLAGFHYYFDKDARMANNKQRLLSSNTREYLTGIEWDIKPGITVSMGAQRTQYGLGDGSYLSDLSFVTSSYSFGIGAKIKVAKNADLNVAYFFTKYEKFNKEYETTAKTGTQEVKMLNTDEFTRTNKVFGVGLDITL